MVDSKSNFDLGVVHAQLLKLFFAGECAEDIVHQLRTKPIFADYFAGTNLDPWMIKFVMNVARFHGRSGDKALVNNPTKGET